MQPIAAPTYMPVHRAQTGICIAQSWNERSGRWWQIHAALPYTPKENAYGTEAGCGRLAIHVAAGSAHAQASAAVSNARRRIMMRRIVHFLP